MIHCLWVYFSVISDMTLVWTLCCVSFKHPGFLQGYIKWYTSILQGFFDWTRGKRERKVFFFLLFLDYSVASLMNVGFWCVCVRVYMFVKGCARIPKIIDHPFLISVPQSPICHLTSHPSGAPPRVPTLWSQWPSLLSVREDWFIDIVCYLDCIASREISFWGGDFFQVTKGNILDTYILQWISS